MDGMPPGITLIERNDSVAGDWFVDIQVLDENPLYKDQIYRPIPMHPHIYSNGIISLDLLGQQGWSPVQSVSSVCMSIQSMLTSNDKDERPPGDEDFVRGNRQRPRDIEFLYHDNTV